MKTVEIKATEYPSISEALQEVNASGRGVVIRVQGKTLVTEKAEAERLEYVGVEFAYVHDHYFEQYDESRVVTVPVNSRE